MSNNHSGRKNGSTHGEAESLGARLSFAREVHGLSTAQLARRLGVKSETLRAWEAGRSEPRANKLAMLSGILGVRPSWILTGVGEGPSARPASEIEAIRAELIRLGEELVSVQARLAALSERLGTYSDYNGT